LETILVVKQSHNSTELVDLMEEFRWMINESIRIGIKYNASSLKTLNSILYHHLTNHTKYLRLYVARSILIARTRLRDFRKRRKNNPRINAPYYKNPYLIVDKNSYKIIGTTLLIGIKPRQSYIGIPLNQYTVQKIATARTGTITITPTTLSISIIKDTKSINPTGSIGIDINLNNATAVHSNGEVNIFAEFAKITQIKERYRLVRSHFKRNDIRIRRKIFQKYGRLQQNKTKQILHNTSKKLVIQKKQLIVEDLNGIRKKFQRGNKRGKEYRAKLNGWPFFEFQRQLEYKSKTYNGIHIIKIKPMMTSSKCSICGAKIIPEENRQIRCQCGHKEDRDINAARNILYEGIQACS
jgi:putative transposase